MANHPTEAGEWDRGEPSDQWRDYQGAPTGREAVAPLEGDRRLDGDIAAVDSVVARGRIDGAVGGWPGRPP
jgi:hypothetical protein